MRSSHNLDRLGVVFDDARQVADAGLLLPATLAAAPRPQGARGALARPGLEARSGERRRQGDDARPVGARGRRLHRRRGRPARRRDGAGAGLHGEGRLDLGHVPAQLPLGARPPVRRHHPRAPRAGVGGGRGSGRCTLHDRPRLHDLRDDGLKKEGALHHGYTKVRGYHPLLAIAAGTGDVLMARLRRWWRAPGARPLPCRVSMAGRDPGAQS